MEESHSTAAFVEVVARDDLLDVFACRGKVDPAQKLLARDRHGFVSADPALGTAGTSVVFGQRKRQWIGLRLPMVECTAQIPGAGLQVRLRIEQLVHAEVDLVL